MNQIKLKAYAKINLGLDVLGRREDGYHEVRMIMQTVRLYDQLTIKKIPKNVISLTTNLKYLPNNENNLVYKAVQLIKDEYQITEGIDMKLIKHIPVSAGMAGGSTDCAAALYGMNRLFDLKISKKQLMEFGVRLGADVPYCLMRGTALSEGIGEKLSPLAPMPSCYILIAKPGVNVSTKYVYENLNLEELGSRPDIDGMIKALKNKDLLGISNRLENVLESVTSKKYPVIDKIKQSMIKHGAMASLMSGSGPTVFGIFEDHSKAKRALYAIKKEELAKQLYLVEPFNITK